MHFTSKKYLPRFESAYMLVLSMGLKPRSTRFGAKLVVFHKLSSWRNASRFLTGYIIFQVKLSIFRLFMLYFCQIRTRGGGGASDYRETVLTFFGTAKAAICVLRVACIQGRSTSVHIYATIKM